MTPERGSPVSARGERARSLILVRREHVFHVVFPRSDADQMGQAACLVRPSVFVGCHRCLPPRQAESGV